MKKYLLILSLIVPILFSFAPAGEKPATITITWKYVGVVDGYDHDAKCKVWIDEEYIGESSVTKESKSNSMTVNTTKGKHHVRIMNLAKYEGDWEEHTIENNYSLDAFYDADMRVKKKSTITLEFNIDSKKTIAKVK